MRLSVCVFVCVCVTLFFQFFLCHKQFFIFKKQKVTKAHKSKILFVTKYLAEPLIRHPKKMKKWDHDRLFLPKYPVCPTFCDAYPVELVNKNLTEAQPGLYFCVHKTILLKEHFCLILVFDGKLHDDGRTDRHQTPHTHFRQTDGTEV